MTGIDDLDLNISLILAISIFMSNKDYMLNSAQLRVDYENCFMTAGPGLKVGNPEDRFSHDETHIVWSFI